MAAAAVKIFCLFLVDTDRELFYSRTFDDIQKTDHSAVRNVFIR